MGLLELFILAVGLSMDAFAVSVCKGLAMPKISVRKAGIVGLWFGGFQALMPALGYLLGYQFRDKITAIGPLDRFHPPGYHRRKHDQGSLFRRL